MSQEILVERLFNSLVNGSRRDTRILLEEVWEADPDPEQVITELLWPTYETIEKLYRADQLSTLSHRLSTRLLRVIADQTAMRLEIPENTHRSVFAFSGPNDADELGAQMAIDLLEACGYEVSYVGGGVPIDEIMAHVQNAQPDVLLTFSTSASDLPDIRRLVDTIRDIGGCPNIQIVVGGGVFNRADGLAEEIGADLWASSPLDLVQEMSTQPHRRATAEQRTVGRKRLRGAA